MARRLKQLDELPVSTLKGVGPKHAVALGKVGVESVLDLLTYYPRRYLDRTRQATVDELVPGEEATIVVDVLRCNVRQTRNRKWLVEAVVTDGTGRLTLTFFNQRWRERQLRPGSTVVVFGKLDVYRGARQMASPVVDLIGTQTGRIVAVYPQSEKAGIDSGDVGRWMAEVLERAGDFADPLSDAVRERWSFVDRTTAFHDIHAPESIGAKEKARARLVFDELLRVQLELVRRKKVFERDALGIEHLTGPPAEKDLVARFHERLPYPLTGAQLRVIDEIGRDLASVHPMHRLLQGDVGAGKTVVAVSALLVAVQGGYQGALMAPTEVLAEQHHLGVGELLRGLTVPDDGTGTLFAGAGMDREVRVELLTNRTTAAERRRLLADLEAGTVDLLIGTHALIQETVGFRALGLVVIDEQHRFGVEQRAAPREKGAEGAVPDVLVMTATPIPRTAAMTVYGDLDVSVLDEMPPGRTPIRTTWAKTDDDELALWEHVRSEVADGHQAYVVCPLIEESEKLEVRSAQETFDELTHPGGELGGLRVGLLHGRVTPAEKEQAMSLFRSGGLEVLVATTVIEVGVDVPNATVMVILDADRFGIAQLHQLRGRVGRGSAVSSCYLVAQPSTPDGETRLEAMVRTTDGFELAEIDLGLRGEGTIMGERQKGRSDLKLASLARDEEWVQRARDVAEALVGDDPELTSEPLWREELDVLLADEEATDFLMKG